MHGSLILPCIWLSSDIFSFRTPCTGCFSPLHGFMLIQASILENHLSEISQAHPPDVPVVDARIDFSFRLKVIFLQQLIILEEMRQ